MDDPIRSPISLPLPAALPGGQSFRRWLSHTFPPHILVGGTDVAKREAAVLTGLSLACLFQPFNGEVGDTVANLLEREESRLIRDPSVSRAPAEVAKKYPNSKRELFHPSRVSEILGCPCEDAIIAKRSSSVEGREYAPLDLRLNASSPMLVCGAAGKSQATSTDTTSRTNSEICVRFMNLDEAEPLQSLAVDTLAARCLLQASPGVGELASHPHSPTGLQRPFLEPGETSAGLKTSTRGVDLPWYAEWSKVIFEGSRFSSHETLSQPVGLILVASINDADPVVAFEQMLQPINLPQMCQQYVLDPNPVRALVLLDIHPDAYQAWNDGSRGGANTTSYLDDSECGLNSVISAKTPGGSDRSTLESPVKASETLDTNIPVPRHSPRAEQLLEQLCSVFPPSNCHLLSIGRGTNKPWHRQVLPAVRYLYSQSISFHYHSSLSGNLIPTPLTVDCTRTCMCGGASGSVTLQGGTKGARDGRSSVGHNTEYSGMRDVATVVRSEMPIPVASRLTATPPTSLHHSQHTGAQATGGGGGVTDVKQRSSDCCVHHLCLCDSYCACLSWQDLHSLSAFVHHFVNASVLPWMERKMRQVDQTITSNRKGFRNQLRYLWRKPKTSSTSSSTGASGAATGIANVAEQAGGAAEAILSAVGGALLGDSAYPNTSAATGLTASGGNSLAGVEAKSPTNSSNVTALTTSYVLHAIEWQYRLLGDLNLFFGLMDSALQSYRSCAADFKQDKRWMQLGGAYEMCAVCLHLCGGSRREVEAYLEQAYNAYVKVSMARLALRCVLLGHRILVDYSNGQPVTTSLHTTSFLPIPQVLHLQAVGGTSSRQCDIAVDCARRLLTANAELPALDTKIWQQLSPAVAAVQVQSHAIRSAMLVEQAALCYEQAGNSHRRKRNFQLVMAGHTYYKSGYKRFALRCYLLVYADYESSEWHYVLQHLRFIMARQTFCLHLISESTRHFNALLNDIAMIHECRLLSDNDGMGLPFIPADREAHYMREFLFVCRVLLEQKQKRGGTESAAHPDNQIPDVDHSSTCGVANSVALPTELRVPFVQMRNSFGQFRDSLTVFVNGDVMPPLHPLSEEDRKQLLDIVGEVGDIAQLSDKRGPLTGAKKKVMELQYVANIMDKNVAPSAIGELQIQQLMIDRLLTHRMGTLQVVHGANPPVSKDPSRSYVDFGVSSPLYESVVRKSAVGCPVFVELRLINPLDIRLELSKVRLYGDLRKNVERGNNEQIISNPNRKETLLGLGFCQDDSGVVCFSDVDVVLEGRESIVLRLSATPQVPGRLTIRGLRLELFGFISVHQPFCEHGSVRRGRNFDIRQCHVPYNADEEATALDGSVGSVPSESLQQKSFTLNQLLNMLHQFRLLPQSELSPSIRKQERLFLEQLPLHYILHLEDFRLLPSGSAIPVYLWEYRERVMETHTPDLRLQIDIEGSLPVLDCSFVNWPTPVLCAQSRCSLNADIATSDSRLLLKSSDGKRCCILGEKQRDSNRAGCGEMMFYTLLTGEERSSCLRIKNMSSCIGLRDVSIGLTPAEIVQVKSAAVTTFMYADVSENGDSLASSVSCPTENSEVYEGGPDVHSPLPVRQRRLKVRPSKTTVVKYGTDCSPSCADMSAVGIVEIYPEQMEDDSQCVSGTRAVDNSGWIVPPCSSLDIELRVNAASAGLHRIRICVRAIAASVNRRGDHTEDILGASDGCETVVWRAVEELLVVGASLELYAEPRLSWDSVGRHLLECRVRNFSKHRLTLEHIRAFIPSASDPSVSNENGSFVREQTGELIGCSYGGFTSTTDTDSMSVPLIPFGSHDTNSESSRTIGPYQELYLLCTTVDPNVFRHFAAMRRPVHVGVRWRLCGHSDAAGDFIIGRRDDLHIDEHCLEDPVTHETAPVETTSERHDKRNVGCRGFDSTAIRPLCNYRYGHIATHQPISLHRCVAGIPLEMQIQVDESGNQREILWESGRPCMCSVIFHLRNLSYTTSLRLVLTGDSAGACSGVPLEWGRYALQLSDLSSDVSAPSRMSDNSHSSFPACGVAFTGLSSSKDLIETSRDPRRHEVGGRGYLNQLAPLMPQCYPIRIENGYGAVEVGVPLEISDIQFNGVNSLRVGDTASIIDNFDGKVNSNNTNLLDVLDNCGQPSGAVRAADGADTRVDHLPDNGSSLPSILPRQIRRDCVGSASNDSGHSPLVDEFALTKLPKSGVNDVSGKSMKAMTHAARARATTNVEEMPDVGALPSIAAASWKGKLPEEVVGKSGCRSIPSTDGFFWVGKVRHDIGVVDPGAEVRAQLTAFFPNPGIYNVSKVIVHVQPCVTASPAQVPSEEQSGRSHQQRMESECYVGKNVSDGSPLTVAFPFDVLVYARPSPSGQLCA